MKWSAVIDFCGKVFYNRVTLNIHIMRNTTTTIITSVWNMLCNTSTISMSLKSTKTKKCQPDAGDRPDLIQTAPVPSIGLARQQIKNQLNEKLKNPKTNHRSHVSSPKCTKTKKCQPDAGDRPDLIQTAPVPSIGLARQQIKNQLNENLKNPKTNQQSQVSSPKCTKTKKCQPDAGDRPDLIQTEPVPSIGLARQHKKNQLNEKQINEKRNDLSHGSANDLVGNLPVANLLPTSRLTLSKEHNSPDSLSVASKMSEDPVHHPDGKWLKDDVTKMKSVSLLSGTHSKVDHTLPLVGVGVPDSGLARPQIKNKQNEKYTKSKSNYLNVTLVNTDESTSSISSKMSTSTKIKTQNCWPAARDTSRKSASIPDSRPAGNKQKNKQNEKNMINKNNNLNLTLVKKDVTSFKSMRTVVHWLTRHNIICLLLLSKVLNPTILHSQSTTQDSWNSSYNTACASIHWEAKDDMLNWQNQMNHILNHHINSVLLQKIHFTAPKKMNTLVKSINGNRQGLSKIKIIHWNLGSRAWENKLVELEVLLAEQKPDICIISESNLWAHTPMEDRHIQGHKIILPDTMESMGHARVAMIVRNEIDVQLLPELMDKETSTIWIKIGKGKKNSWTIGGIYREHVVLGRGETHLSGNERQRLQEWRWQRIVNKWQQASRNQRCLVMGDLNLDFLRWHNPDFAHEAMVEAVQDNIEINGFTQLVENYTRQWEGQVNSCLDHIWTNTIERVICHQNMTRGDADHNLISVELSCKDVKIGGMAVRKRIWKNFDLKTCTDKFRNTDWSDILEIMNVDVATSTLEERILTILDEAAPIKLVQMRTNYNNYISDSTKVTMTRRDITRDIAIMSGSHDDWQSYRKLRNLCTSLQRRDKSNYLKNIYESIDKENDAAKLFATTRNLLGNNRAGPPSRFLKAGRSVTKHKQLAEIQAQHYEDKVSRIKELLPRVNSDPLKFIRRAYTRWSPAGGKPTFVLKTTNVTEVTKIIDKMKNSHAYGHDALDAYIIKIAAPSIAPAIAHCINLSLGLHTFPTRWKIARVLPLLKSTDSDPNLPGSYRPIAQLSILSKITERVVQSQLLHYLETTAQISSQHHAYRHKCSTTTTLIQIMDYIAEGVDENMITSTLSVDQSAAFDCVDHSILLSKLHFYGIKDDAYKWIESYLKYRSYYVSVGTGNSTMKTLKFGVPQGSCIGPLLYLLYVNDFPTITENEDCRNPVHSDPTVLFGGICNNCGVLPVYADDGLFLFRSNQRNLNQDIIIHMFVKIRDFLNTIGLEVNEGKTSLTEYMVAQKRAKIAGIPPELTVTEKITDINTMKTTLRDKHITDSTSTRLLGMNLQGNTLWESHLFAGKRALIPACRRQLGQLYRLKNCLSYKNRLHLSQCSDTKQDYIWDLPMG